MHSKMKWMPLLLMAVLLPSCASSGSTPASAAAAAANKSALYDPPTVTTRPGGIYEFAEGVLIGTGQKWHSDYSYRRAVIIGTPDP